MHQEKQFNEVNSMVMLKQMMKLQQHYLLILPIPFLTFNFGQEITITLLEKMLTPVLQTSHSPTTTKTLVF